jgi:hypothetical protein
MEAMEIDPMDSDPDATVFDLRAELFELLDELKELRYTTDSDIAVLMMLLDSWKPRVTMKHTP